MNLSILNHKAAEFHVHTTYTDGSATVFAMAERAVTIGLAKIVFTEHTESWKIKYKEWFADYLTDINKAKEMFDGRIEIIAGLEAPATDFNDGLCITDEMEEKVDFSLGAAHRYPGLAGKRIADLERDDMRELDISNQSSLSGNDRIDAIAHIGATC